MIIGLTGGIGSGKSIVAKLFETIGCANYNSDDRAKELYFKPIIKQAVIELLGTEAYVSETVINKDYISKKVFSDTKLLHQLNDIIHPAVKEDFIQFKSKFPLNTIIIKESALLFETSIYKDLNYNILVTAPIHIKIERVMKRNSVSKSDIEKRIQAQWTDEQKIPLANAIIVNDNDTALIPQVISIIEKTKNQMHKRDYLVKQFEEFGKVMAILLGLKKDGQFPELSDSIEEALRKYTLLEIKYVESISNESLVETLTQEKNLNDEQLKMLADLIYEKGEYYTSINSPENTSSNCYKKAFLIYLFLKENATLNYSLDMHYKLEILSKMGL